MNLDKEIEKWGDDYEAQVEAHVVDGEGHCTPLESEADRVIIRCMMEIDRLRNLLLKREWITEVMEIVEEQANDEGLWCDAVYASEAYIQKALRRLHEVIEQKTSEECAINVIPPTV